MDWGWVPEGGALIAGSWEIKEANSVLCAILHTDVTTLGWSFGLRNLIIPGRDDLRQFHPFLPLSGMPFDHARNASAMRTLEVGAEWLYCYDSDVIPPRDAIVRLMKHQHPIMSGMYCRRSPPWSVPVMIKDGQWVTNFRPGSVVEVDLVGAGCLLIHRSVLEAMKPQRPGKHWFDWRVDLAGMLPPGEGLSEDFTFCVAAKRQLGVVTKVDTSVKCRHVGYGESEFMSYKPMECNPIT